VGIFAGDACGFFGSSHDAIVEVQTAVKMDPQFKSAKGDLKRLQS
jgi:hypothetical protein